MKKFFFLNYLIRLFLVNIFGIIFLYDTTSLNQGIFSFQSFFYSLNSIIFFVFVTFETIFSYLQYYGLDFEFFNLILLDITNINYNFVVLVLLDKSKYLVFFILTLIISINQNFIINLLSDQRKLLLKNRFKVISFLLFIVVLFFFYHSMQIKDL